MTVLLFNQMTVTRASFVSFFVFENRPASDGEEHKGSVNVSSDLAGVS